MKTIIAILGILLAGTTALGAEPTAPPAAAADAHARAVAGFVDPMTILVVRIDMTRAGVDAVFEQIKQSLVRLIPNVRERLAIMERLQKSRSTLGQAAESFVKAGGRDLYIVVSLMDVPMQGPPFAVAPLPSGADPAALAAAMESLYTGKSPGTQPATQPATSSYIRTARIRGAMVAGTERTLQRLQAMESSTRPEMARAFTAVAESDVQAVLVPSEDVRRVLVALVPTPNAKLATMQEQLHAAINGLAWGALGVSVQPEMTAKAAVQAESPEAAAAIHDVLAKSIEIAFQPGEALGPSSQQATQPIPAEQRLLVQILPQPKGSRLEQHLDRQQLDVLATVAGRAFARSQRFAERSHSAANIASLLRATFIYYNKHKGQWPDSLQTLVDEFRLQPEALVNPERPEMKPGYVYIKPMVPENKIDPFQIIFHDRFDEWGEGANVGFADGHAEFIADKTQFDKWMAKTKADNAAAAKTK